MEEFLKSKNIRVTSFRTQVLEVFTTQSHAIELSNIEEALGNHDRITLYRTLKTFLDKGIIHEIALPGENKKMALCESNCKHSKDDDPIHNHEHIHFQCLKCGEVKCLSEVNFPKVKIPGFEIQQLNISAKGHCDSCS